MSRHKLRIVLAGLLAYVPLTMVEVFWHDTLFGAYYDSVPYIVRAEPAFAVPAVAAIFRGLLLSMLYPRFARRGSTLVAGFEFGAVIGLLTAMYWIPSYYAQQAIPELIPWFGVEAAFFLLQGVAAGIVIALVQGRAATRTAHAKEPALSTSELHR